MTAPALTIRPVACPWAIEFAAPEPDPKLYNPATGWARHDLLGPGGEEPADYADPFNEEREREYADEAEAEHWAHEDARNAAAEASLADFLTARDVEEEGEELEPRDHGREEG